VDVAIIGGGWSGLLMAKELGARTALSIAVLERGAPRRSQKYVEGMDELDYAIRLRMMQDASKETVTFRHASKDKALPLRQFASFLPGDGVGGAGEHWNASTPRFLPDVFDIHTRTTGRYGASRLPENHSVQDWGIKWDEIEPWYTKAEQLLGCSGTAGADRFEGKRSAGFPVQALKTPYFPSLFEEAAHKLGYSPYPMPAAILSRPYKNPDGIIRAACAYCGFCDRFGCMVGAKAQPTNVLLPVVSRQKTVSLRTGANVRRIVHKAGKATGVTYIDDKGEECLQPADLVILSSWTLNNTRMLLLSNAGEAYNAATGKGVVGRNLTHQVAGVDTTLFFDKPLNSFMGSGSSCIVIHDFDGDNFDHSGLDFVRGAQLAANNFGRRPVATFGIMPPSVKGTWGATWKKAGIEWFDRTARIAMSGEHLAYKTNYFDLDPVYKDNHGDPLLRLTIDWNDNERNMVRYISAKAVEIGRAMGVREIVSNPLPAHYDVNVYKSTHVQGGTIMGTSPETSVVSPWLQHWQVDNLFVLGASTFPQNASGNPTLTLLAQTLRTADAVVERYLKRPGRL
jgi:gluconate 2-dehydrogenase alpha chain